MKPLFYDNRVKQILPTKIDWTFLNRHGHWKINEAEVKVGFLINRFETECLNIVLFYWILRFILGRFLFIFTDLNPRQLFIFLNRTHTRNYPRHMTHDSASHVVNMLPADG